MAEQQPPWMVYLKERWMFLLFPTLIVLSILVGIIQHWKPPALHSITIDPAQINLVVGKDIPLKASGERVNGKHVPDLPITWAVQGPQAKISAEGVLTALEPGETQVTATAEHVVGTATLRVAEEPVATLTATATPAEVAVGGQTTLTAELRGASGRQLKNLEVRFQALTPATTVAAPSTMTDQQGRATVMVTAAPQAGDNQIAVQAGDRKVTAVVRGVPGAPAAFQVHGGPTTGIVAGATVPLQVIVHDAHGNAVPKAALRFIGQNAGTEAQPAEVTTDAEGKASTTVQTRPTMGLNLLEVQVEALPRQQISMTTQAGAAARLHIQTDPPMPFAGTEAVALVQVQDAHGNPVAGSKVDVTLPGTAAPQTRSAVSDANGMARMAFSLGAVPGDYTLEATAPGLTAQQHTLTARPPAALFIEPASADVEMQGAQAFKAFGADDKGKKLLEVPAVWQVKGSVGSITATGVLTAKSLGKGSIVATYGNVTTEAQVTVIPGAVATLQITPSEMTVSSGKTQTFRVRAFNAQKYAFEVTPTWQVAGDVGTIDDTGQFVATKAGSGEVVAMADGKSIRAKVTVTPGPLAAIRVQPERVQLQAGKELQLQALGSDAAGNAVELTPSWSLTGELGELSADGLLKAQRTGVGEIQVIAGNPPVRAAITVEVAPASLHRLEITPPTATLKAGDSQSFTVTGLDAFGNTRKVQAAWRLSADIGTIDAAGTLTATRVGQGQVEATVEGVKAQANVAVQAAELAMIRVEPPGPLTLQAGAKAALRASGQDAYGNVVTITPEWSQEPQLGTLNPAGEFQAEKVGTGTLTVSSGAKRATVPVTVTPGTLARFLVPAATLTIRAGEKQRFEAQGVDAFGNPVMVQPTWSVTNNIGTMTAAGEFTATQARKGEVVIAQGQVSQRIAVTVQPGPLHMLQVSPEMLTITAGRTVELVAAGYDIHGNRVAIQPTWQIAEHLGNITPEGKLTAHKVGQGEVVAMVDQKQVSVALEVTPGPLTFISIEPGSFALRVGAQQVFKATGRDAQGNEVTITPVWNLQGDIGKIDAQGVFQATSPGQGVIGAVVGTIQGKATGKVEAAQ